MLPFFFSSHSNTYIYMCMIIGLFLFILLFLYFKKNGSIVALKLKKLLYQGFIGATIFKIIGSNR